MLHFAVMVFRLTCFFLFVAPMVIKCPLKENNEVGIFMEFPLVLTMKNMKNYRNKQFQEEGS